jgi:steroid delta-isomerase-like uncharacterized protein
MVCLAAESSEDARFTDKSMEQYQFLIQRSEGQFTPLALSAATTAREKPRRSQGKENKMTTQNTIEENKRIVRAFIETAFNQHQADRAAEYLTPDMQWHGGTLGTVEGREKVAGLVSAIVSALPDLHNVEQDIIAERDIVVVRAVVEATHKGDLLGIPASGRHVRWDAVDVYRVADGRIAEEWAADDLLAFVYGVGAYTPPWLS